MACEIMVCNQAVRACIRDDKVHQIYSIMQAGKKHGMQTLNDSLKELYLQREVTLEEALKRSSDTNEFLQMVGEPIPA
jgi:twitching motility protein PilT